VKVIGNCSVLHYQCDLQYVFWCFVFGIPQYSIGPESAR